MNGPLARLGAIKTKLGALVVLGIAVTVTVLLVGQRLDTPTWLAVLIGVVVSLVAVELLATGLTAPLRQMAAQADVLAVGGAVADVDDTANDEVGELARSFNAMAAQVARTDRLRRDLVANVSHELRTPIAALSAVVENLADGIEPVTDDALRRIDAQAARLRSLTEHLLDLSQLDAGVVTLDVRPVPLAGLVADVLDTLPPALARRVAVDVPATVAVAVDPSRFRQVLDNLVTNALRHGPDDTPVTVSAGPRPATTPGRETPGGEKPGGETPAPRTGRSDDADRVRIVVEDRGPGIAAADAERVFERFARADGGRASTSGGAGLGLAITRWVTRLHGGTVHVERPGDPGARFVVEVPAARTPAADPPTRVTNAGTATDVAVTPDLPSTRADLTEPPMPVTSSSEPDASPTTTSEAAAAGPGTLRTPRGAAQPDGGSSSAGPSWPPPRTATTERFAVLPTPVGGLGLRSLAAALTAGLVTAMLGSVGDSPIGLGFALTLVVGGVATIVALEQRLDRFGWACSGLALAVAVLWTVSDAAWLLGPLTFGAVFLAGIGIWGPRRFGEHLRAMVLGPLLAAVAPVALVRAREEIDLGERDLPQLVVPVVGATTAVVVFGALLTGGDAVFASLVEAVVPDLSLDAMFVYRGFIGALAVAMVVTYVLAQRAGTVDVAPWARPVRPRLDWALPVGALVGLFGLFLAVQAATLFGGDDLVRRTTGLTYAEYAVSGFWQLLVVAMLVLGVVAAVVRVAADEDRRVRDLLLAVLVGQTVLLLVSAVQRLVLYVETFGLTRSRLVGLVVLGWVAVMLLMVAAVRTRPEWSAALPRAIVVTTAAIAVAFAASAPDAIIARWNLDRFERTGSIDRDYLLDLTADAVPTLVDEPSLRDRVLRGVGLEELGSTQCSDLEPQPWNEANLARSRAADALASSKACGDP